MSDGHWDPDRSAWTIAAIIGILAAAAIVSYLCL